MFLWILLLDLFGSCFSYKTLLLSFESFYSNWWFTLCLHNSCSILLRSRKRQKAKKPKATRATKAAKATKATRAKKPDWEKKRHHITYVTTRADPSLSELDVLQVQLPDFEGGRPVPAVQSRSSAVEWSHRNMQKWKLQYIQVYNRVYNGFSLKFLLPLPILELLRSPESFSQPQVPELGLRQLGALPPGTRMLKQIFCDCLIWFVDI